MLDLCKPCVIRDRWDKEYAIIVVCESFADAILYWNTTDTLEECMPGEYENIFCPDGEIRVNKKSHIIYASHQMVQHFCDKMYAEWCVKVNRG